MNLTERWKTFREFLVDVRKETGKVSWAGEGRGGRYDHGPSSSTPPSSACSSSSSTRPSPPSSTGSSPSSATDPTRPRDMTEHDGTPALTDTASAGAVDGLVHRPHVLGLRGPRRPGADEPDQGPGHGVPVRRDPRAEGDRRRDDERRAAPQRRAQVLPGLRPRPDGDGRRDLAPRSEHHRRSPASSGAPRRAPSRSRRRRSRRSSTTRRSRRRSRSRSTPTIVARR